MALRTRIKFCGLTRAADIDLAVELGVDAIGLVFDARSKRYLDLKTAAALRARIPALVSAVALFRDADAQQVAATIDAIQPDVLQFHGLEAPEFCAQWRRSWVKALGMLGEQDLSAQLQRYRDAGAVLLDGHAPGAMGGGGSRFDWSGLPCRIQRPWLLAGGLAPDNVASAVRMAAPFGVDVSSGIEASPGVKDAARMRAFVQAVRSADHDQSR